MRLFLIFFAIILQFFNNANAQTCTGTTYMNPETQTCTPCPFEYTYNRTDGKTDITQWQTKCTGGQYVSEARLTSDGNAYIDTGIISTGQTYVELKFQYTTTPDMSNQNQVYAVWGAIPKNYKNNQNAPITPRISFFAHLNDFCVGVNSTIQIAPFDNDIHTVKINAATGELYFDNVLHKFQTDSKLVMPFTSYLYARQTLTGPDTITNGLIIYRYTEYDKFGGTLLRDMYPTVDKNGVVCMFDKVSQSYFYNAGDGEFAKPFGCTNVGPGYWSPESIVNYGTIGTRNKCPNNLTTIGYGAGADEADDCGRILHVGPHKIYLRSAKKTTPALHVRIGNTIFYGNASPEKLGHLRVKYNNTTYSIHDDSVYHSTKKSATYNKRN